MRNNGGFIGSVPTTTSGTSGVANGVWSLQAANNRKQRGIWPDAPDPVTDPSFSNVKVLLPFDSNDIDVSNNTLTPSRTSIGSSAVTASGKFGSYWQHQQGMLTYSTGTWGSTSDGDYWIFEAWIKRTGNTWQGSSGTQATGLLKFGVMELRGADTSLYWYDDDDEGTVATLASTTTQNQWYHILVHRSISSVVESFYFYLDGVNKQLKQFITSQHTQPNSFKLGASTGTARFDADDIRLTENANRHSITAGSNFTPPTTPHPTQ